MFTVFHFPSVYVMGCKVVCQRLCHYRFIEFLDINWGAERNKKKKSSNSRRVGGGGKCRGTRTGWISKLEDQIILSSERRARSGCDDVVLCPCLTGRLVLTIGALLPVLPRTLNPTNKRRRWRRWQRRRRRLRRKGPTCWASRHSLSSRTAGSNAWRRVTSCLRRTGTRTPRASDVVWASSTTPSPTRSLHSTCSRKTQLAGNWKICPFSRFLSALLVPGAYKHALTQIYVV